MPACSLPCPSVLTGGDHDPARACGGEGGPEEAVVRVGPVGGGGLHARALAGLRFLLPAVRVEALEHLGQVIGAVVLQQARAVHQALLRGGGGGKQQEGRRGQ